MTEQPLALTIDIGTSSTRVLLWDIAGHEIEGIRAQVTYRMHTTPDGGVEMPAEELEQHVGSCIDQALAQAGDRARSIRAVGMSTFWHSLLGLDTAGQSLTPVYSWADTRAAQAARRLRAELDEQAIHARTGCMLHPSYYPAKLVWLRETQRAVYDRVARWASPSEYLFGRWFGVQARCVSLSMASGTGLLNQARCVWDEETLQAIGLPAEKLAPIVDLSQRSEGLQGDYAARWPALQNVPFFPAVGDGACGNVGSGCVSPERLAINLGTSGAIRALWNIQEAQQPGTLTKVQGSRAAAPNGQPSDTRHPTPATLQVPLPAPPQGLWLYRVDAHRPLMGAAFSDGGIVYEWMNRTLKLPEMGELERQVAAMQPGAHGLIFLPFLAGERSMGWNPTARAALIGMNLDTGPVEMLQAALEGVALRFSLAAQALKSVFPQVREIVASGGALGHSPTWTQMFADAIGQPVTLAAEPEASSRGAALLALEAAGLIGGPDEAQARLSRTFAPDPARHALYTDLLARQQALYTKLIASADDADKDKRQN